MAVAVVFHRLCAAFERTIAPHDMKHVSLFQTLIYLIGLHPYFRHIPNQFMTMLQQDSAQQPARRLSYFNDALSLCTVDFPIYYIESISERHVVIAGGGGVSKTGVHNQIVLIELSPSNGSCFATFIAKFRDIPDAIMTGSLMKDLPIAKTRLVTGGANPIVYQLSYDSANKIFNVKEHDVLKDAKTRSEVKSVRYCAGKLYAGGVDGQLTVWDDKNVACEVKAHTKEIDEVDVNHIDGHVLTLSRGEGRFVIWDSSNLKMIKEFINKDFNRIAGVTYCVRTCKYIFEKSKKVVISSLIVACNPIPAKNQACQLCRISIKNNEMSVIAIKPILVDSVMAMTVSSNGKLIAIGTSSGGVAMFDARNLSQIYSINNAHQNTVTGLEFLPSTQESLALANCKICPLLSVSIDRRLILHRPRDRSLPMRWLRYVMIMLAIYLMFVSIQKCIT